MAAADRLKQLQPTELCRRFHNEYTLASALLFEDYIGDPQYTTLQEAALSMMEIVNRTQLDSRNPCP